jgi:uncharacterized OsmC-like protein
VGDEGGSNLPGASLRFKICDSCFATDPAPLGAAHGPSSIDSLTRIPRGCPRDGFEFRAKNEWIDGVENRSTVRDFWGAGHEDDSRERPFVFTNGEPPVPLGNNEGANPVEFLLHALAGCVTTTIVLHAAARGIRIDRLSTRLAGDLDLQGLLGLDDAASPGYERIKIELEIEAARTRSSTISSSSRTRTRRCARRSAVRRRS